MEEVETLLEVTVAFVEETREIPFPLFEASLAVRLTLVDSRTKMPKSDARARWVWHARWLRPA